MVGRAGQRAVFVRSDAEPAIGDVVKEAVSRREEKTELQLSPKRSKGALGAAEATNFAVESQLRTRRLGLLARYPSEKVSGENRLVAWMVRHCGWLLTRFQMKATGRTAYYSRVGAEYRREIVEFAEQVLFPFSESSGPGATVGKLMPRWDLGVWVGKINDSDEHVLLTPFGSKRATGIRGLPERSKWNSDFLKTVRGLPWNPMETEVEKVTTVDIGKARRLYITKAMVVESGETLGCLGCTGIQKFHDENSRMRFEIIYLHTAAMPTTAAPIPESETPTCADAADEEAVTAMPSSAAEKRKSESDDETVETKRTAVEMSAKDVEMNNTECNDEVTADPVR